jgi:hypothetical protein
MIIKAIYIGNSEEAFVLEDFQSGLNIISSDDNNKGKTIVIQSIAYCLGNIPVFPTAFDYENYFHILHIEHQNEIIKICRKSKNYIVKKGSEYAVFDNTSEFKRYWSKNIQALPLIKKDNVWRIVDPELLVQVFFVGQDKKTTSNIVNRGWYKKEDFYALLYAMSGIGDSNTAISDVETIKKKIRDLKTEKNALLKENKILQKHDAAFEYLSVTNDKMALESILKEAEQIKNKLLLLKKERANAVSRRAKNEMALKELRSLNRTMKAGQISCLDCGSSHIAYESADSEFSFDISTATMRNQILDSIQEKVDIYNEEIIRLTGEINSCQNEFDLCLDTKDVPLEALLVVRREMEDARDADQRISEIDSALQKLGEQLEKKEAISDDVAKKCKSLLDSIIKEMNKFYKFVDLARTVAYDDIFTPKDKTYSGSEATEFHLARMYAFVKILKHDFPIIVDSFRAEDLSSDREKRALQMFEHVSNQIIFTTTLKNEESNKYVDYEGVHNIDFSSHATNKMLSVEYMTQFLNAAKDMMITVI